MAAPKNPAPSPAPMTEEQRAAELAQLANAGDYFAGIESNLRAHGIDVSRPLDERNFAAIKESLKRVAAISGADPEKAGQVLDEAYKQAVQETKKGLPSFTTIEYDLLKAGTVKELFKPEFLKPEHTPPLEDKDPTKFRG